MGLFGKKKEKTENRVEDVIKNPKQYSSAEVFTAFGGDNITEQEALSFFNYRLKMRDKKKKSTDDVLALSLLERCDCAFTGAASNYPKVLVRIAGNIGLLDFVKKKIDCLDLSKFRLADYPNIFEVRFDSLKAVDYSKVSPVIDSYLKRFVWDRLKNKYSANNQAALKHFFGYRAVIDNDKIISLPNEYMNTEIFALMNDEQKKKYLMNKILKEEFQAYLRIGSEGREWLKFYVKHSPLCSVIEYAELMMGTNHNNVVIVDKEYVEKHKLSGLSLKAIKEHRNAALNGYYLNRRDLSYADLDNYMKA